MKILTIIFSAGLSVGLFLSCASSPDETGDHGFDGLDNPDQYDNDSLDWQPANLTWYTSYPDPGSDECLYYNGCTWSGYFSFFNTKQTEEWVKNTHIVAVHENDWGKYGGKILRIRQGNNQIDARVYDMCSDSDCDGCCTRNSSETGFLVDLEYYTMQEFGGEHGTVEWACLDC